MKKYQITEITEKFNNAGTKANSDVACTARGMGFMEVPVRMNTTVHSIRGKLQRQAGYMKDWANAVRAIEPGSVVLLQHPFHHRQMTREKSLREIKKKKVRYISFVHDVEELRGFRYSAYYEREFRTMLELADVLVVHNDVMKQWFMEKGAAEEKLVSLGIFDYLQEGVACEKTFEKSLTIAGNLDRTKCGYLAELGKLRGIRFDLFGVNFDESMRDFPNVSYHGEYPMDVIPSRMTRGFGLVWDGNSAAGCSGEAGSYLRYNDPHKLSLYLSSGLPVVIWSGAAEADFVRKNGVGICTESLYQAEHMINTVTSEEYAEMCRNAERIAEPMRKGRYTETALREALKRILTDAGEAEE